MTLNSLTALVKSYRILGVCFRVSEAFNNKFIPLKHLSTLFMPGLVLGAGGLVVKHLSVGGHGAYVTS